LEGVNNIEELNIEELFDEDGNAIDSLDGLFYGYYVDDVVRYSNARKAGLELEDAVYTGIKVGEGNQLNHWTWDVQAAKEYLDMIENGVDVVYEKIVDERVSTGIDETKIDTLTQEILSSDSFLARSFIDNEHYKLALEGKDPDGNDALHLKESPWLAYDVKEPGSFEEWKKAKAYLNDKIKNGENKIEIRTILDLYGAFEPSLLSSPIRKAGMTYPLYFLPGAKVNDVIGVIALPQDSLDHLKELNKATGNHLQIDESSDALFDEEGRKTLFDFKEGEMPLEFKLLSVNYADGEKSLSSLNELIDWYNGEVEKGELGAVELAARFQQQFTLIHPLTDYNGRISRLLMDYILQSNGLTPSFLDDTLGDTWFMPEQWVGEVKEGVERSEDVLQGEMDVESGESGG